VAALLRFVTLDVQSFSNDEPFTVGLATGPLDAVLSTVKTTESSPPLYPYLAWVWEKAFGTGETGMRLLPALLGTLLVPVTWAAARVTLPGRSALIAAALVTLSPLLVWYSQEARAYALFALLATLAFLFFARLLRAPRDASGTRDLLAWSVLSAAAVLTHYFAVVPFAAQLLWLLAERRELRRPVALVALCVIMLAVDVAVPLDDRLQRDDWEELMASAGRPGSDQAVAVLRGFENSRVAALYLPGGGGPPGRRNLMVRELTVVGDPSTMAAFVPAAAGAGFTLVDRETRGPLRLARLHAPSPVELPSQDVFGLADLVVSR
jgi:hypothetical protein